MNYSNSVEEKRKKIQENINFLFSNLTEYEEINFCISYSLFNSGKNIRGILFLLLHGLFKENNEDSFKISAIIEIIHSSSLMLDDLPIMDNAELRRGKKTPHLVYGEDITLISCLKIFTKTLKELSDIKKVQLEFLDLIDILLIGQYEDLHILNNIQSEEELIKIYKNKTGYFFEFIGRILNIILDIEGKDKENIDKFLSYLGIAFQIKDDILDFESSSEKTGKDFQKDIKNQKKNYISFFGIEKAKEDFFENFEKSINYLEKVNADVKEIKDLVLKLKK